MRIINRQTSRGKQLQIFSLSHAQPSVRPPTHLRNISQNNVLCYITQYNKRYCYTLMS